MSFNYSTLITDRTAADVEAVKSLLAKPSNQWTVAEMEAFLAGVLRGAYNASDINRVTAAVEALSHEFVARGYQDPYTPVYAAEGRTEWREEDEPTAPQMAGYLSNVRRVREALASDLPYPPDNMDGLTVEEANTIEKILGETKRILGLIDKSVVMSETPSIGSASGEAEAYGATEYIGGSLSDYGET